MHALLEYLNRYRKKVIIIVAKFSLQLKNASILSIGQIISQLISFISIPIITRKLGPELYGNYTTVTAYVGIFALLNLGGITKVLVRESKGNINILKKNIESIIRFKIFLSFFSFFLTIIIALFIPEYNTRLLCFIVLYSFNIFPLSFRPLLGAIYQTTEKMKYISYFSLLQRIFSALGSIFVVLLNGGIMELIVLNVLVNFTVVIINYQYSKTFIKINIFHKYTFNKGIIKPALLFTSLGILGFLQTRIDIIMLSWMGTAKEVGFYSVAFGLIKYLGTFRSQISAAFFPWFVKTQALHSLKMNYLFKSFGLLLIITTILGIIISFMSSKIVLFLFGSDYAISGEILSVLIFYLTIGYATIPLTNAILSSSNEKSMIQIGIINAISNIILNYVLYKKFGIIGIAYSTLVVMGIILPINYILVLIRLKKRGVFS